MRERLQHYQESITGKRFFAQAQLQEKGFLNKRFILETPFPFACEEARIRDELSAFGVAVEALQFQPQVKAYSPRTGSVKNIIAVASGKGGVGKSTVAVNLALALQLQGAKVGILDADLYGPSIALMLGGAKKPAAAGKIQPIQRHGLESLSIADLLDSSDDAVIWRGPLVTQTLIQMLRDSDWGELDYLILDLPPTTGDVPLTLAQQTAVAGVVLVTTPQDVALSDARKLKTMLDKVAIPVLGLVENMAFFCCPNCHHESALFGSDGGKRLAERYALPLFARFPLEARIHADCDAGKPTVIAAPQHTISRQYEILALQVMVALAEQGSASTPQIEME